MTWADHTGEVFATTVPHGPIAHIKRQTFDQRATRVTRTIRAANHATMRAAAVPDVGAGWAQNQPQNQPQNSETDAAREAYLDDLWLNSPAKKSDEWGEWKEREDWGESDEWGDWKASGYPDEEDDPDAWDEWAGPWDHCPEDNDPQAMERLCKIDPALRMNPGNLRWEAAAEER